MKHISEVDQYIDEAGETQQIILNNLRDLIEKTVPDASEHFKWNQPVYHKHKNFCYLRYTKKQVNLGFFNFSNIDDPQNLLEGSGKTMRHVKIFDWRDVEKEILQEMILQAAKE